jgi:uncharacterized protein YbaP (TraB family)
MAWVFFRGRRAPRRLSILLGAAAVALSSPLAATAPARPALWVVQDADTTVYIFGTFHTLDARQDWLTPQVAQALRSAGELVLETIVPENPDTVGAAKEARDSDYLKGAAKVMRDGHAKGMSTVSGADQVLRLLAEASGTPVSGLEDFGEQLQTLARIKSTPVPASAVAAPAVRADVSLDQLLAAWRAGDTGAFATMLSGFKAKAPAAYDALIAERNRHWANWVQKRLAAPGVVFVAVGSGHLSGDDSVQASLLEQGIRARRIG